MKHLAVLLMGFLLLAFSGVESSPDLELDTGPVLTAEVSLNATGVMLAVADGTVAKRNTSFHVVSTTLTPGIEEEPLDLTPTAQKQRRGYACCPSGLTKASSLAPHRQPHLVRRVT